jgi:hypothetical protein
MMEPETIAATGYPSTEHSAFYQLTLLPSGLHERIGGLDFQQGMNSVVHRHRTASEASARFADLLVEQDTGVEGYYLIETELFVFFTAAVAAVESACWALHGLGCALDPGAFPMNTNDERERVNPTETASRFRGKWTRADPLTKRLILFANGDEFIDLRGRRNRLSHRALPARQIDVTVNEPGSETVTRIYWDDEPLKPDLTANRLNWLTGALADLWAAGAQFMQARRADQSWPPGGEGV